MTRVPELRFAGFDGEWEESVLDKNLISLKSGLSRKLSDYDIGIPVVRANNTYDNRLDLKKNIKYWYDVDPKGADTNNYVIEKNDILINFINSMSKMGTAALVRENPERKTIYTTNIMRLRTNKSLNPFFYLMLTLTVNYRKYIESISMQAVNQSSFTTTDYRRYKFYKPSYIEQEKIGDLFSKIDQLIESQQELVDQTIAFKKSMLQKMFPKKDSLVPEFRFNDFNTNWEIKKVKDLLDYEQPTKYIVSNDEYIEEGIPVLTANKSFLLGYTDEENYYDNGEVILIDDFTLDSKYVDFKFMVKSSALKILTPKDSNLFFIFNLLNNTKFITEGHKRHYISIIQETNVAVPSLEEQEKIGNFFKILDEKIAKEEKLLDAYKDMKKSLLQKMFV